MDRAQGRGRAGDGDDAGAIGLRRGDGARAEADRRRAAARGGVGFQAWVFALTALGVFGALLFFAGDRPFPATALAVVSFTGLALCMIGDAARPARSRDADIALPAALAVAVLAWALLQLAPGALGGGPSGVEGPLSADPSLGWRRLMTMASYPACFWIAARGAESVEAARRAIDVFALGAAAVAVYAIAAAFLGENPLMDDRFEQYGVVNGTFANENHFGLFCAMGLTAALAAADRRLFSRRGARAVDVARDLVDRAGGLYVAAAMVLAVAAALSDSRAGALFAGLAALGYILARRRSAAGDADEDARESRLIPFMIAIAVAGFSALIIVLAGERLLGTLSNVGDLVRAVERDGGPSPTRELAYQLTLEAILREPWLGHGIGSFEESFRSYMVAGFGRLDWARAHNLILEVAFELGVPAAAAWFLAVTLVLWRILVGFVRRRRARDVLGVVVVCAGVGVLHSMVDFPLQIPALAAIFAMILGVGWAQSFSSRAERSTRSRMS